MEGRRIGGEGTGGEKRSVKENRKQIETSVDEEVTKKSSYSNVWDYIDEAEPNEPIRTYKAQAPYVNLK